MGVYCLQFDKNILVIGLRNNTIQMFQMKNLEFICSLEGHTGSVLSLQFENDLLISGSSDGTIKLWSLLDKTCIETYSQHKAKVNNIKFDLRSKVLLSISENERIFLWQINTSPKISLCLISDFYNLVQMDDTNMSLTDRRCNAIDFNLNYITVGLFNRIFVWENFKSFDELQSPGFRLNLKNILNGHEMIITCLTINTENFIFSGSVDSSIRVWSIEFSMCLKVLRFHDQIICSIRFDHKRLLTGSYELVYIKF